jgi:hypothetical protein
LSSRRRIRRLVEIDAGHLGVGWLVELLAGHRHRLEDAAVDVAAGQEERAMLLGDAACANPITGRRWASHA